MRFLVVFIVFFFSITANGQTNCDYNGAVFSLVKNAPARKITRNESYRNELVTTIVSVANKHGIDPMLLITTLYRESSFKLNVTGSLGETGMGQVHGLARRGCNMKTARGQIDCAASWLSMMIAKCGTVYNGVSAYLSGRCKPKGKVVTAISRRLNLAIKLNKRFCSGL
jgi:hypothetical protein